MVPLIRDILPQHKSYFPAQNDTQIRNPRASDSAAKSVSAQLAMMAKQNKLRNGFRLGGIERQTERRRNREVRHAPAGTGALTLTLDPTARLDQERYSAQMDEGTTGA